MLAPPGTMRHGHSSPLRGLPHRRLIPSHVPPGSHGCRRMPPLFVAAASLASSFSAYVSHFIAEAGLTCAGTMGTCETRFWHTASQHGPLQTAGRPQQLIVGS